MRRLWTAISVVGLAASILTGSGAWQQVAREIAAAALGGAFVAFLRRRPHVDYMALRKLCEEVDMPWTVPSLGWFHREIRRASRSERRRAPFKRVGSWFARNGDALARTIFGVAGGAGVGFGIWLASAPSHPTQTLPPGVQAGSRNSFLVPTGDGKALGSVLCSYDRTAYATPLPGRGEIVTCEAEDAEEFRYPQSRVWKP